MADTALDWNATCSMSLSVAHRSRARVRWFVKGRHGMRHLPSVRSSSHLAKRFRFSDKAFSKWPSASGSGAEEIAALRLGLDLSPTKKRDLAMLDRAFPSPARAAAARDDLTFSAHCLVRGDKEFS